MFSYTNLFAQTDSVVVDHIFLSGNKKTKDYIILRELDFDINDSLSLADSSKIIEACQNKIFNTKLFISVEVALIKQGHKRIDVLILLKERWYIFPIPILELADRNVHEWRTQHNLSLSRLDWGLRFRHENFRGRKENLKIVLQSGFTKKYEIFHDIPYINKAKTLGLSYGLSYSTNKSVSYDAIKGNKLSYFDSEDILRKRFYTGASLRYRKRFFVWHELGMYYHNNNISNELLTQNSQYLGEGKLQQQFMKLYYVFDINKTNIHYYPTQGWSLNTSLNQYGLGIFRDVSMTEFKSALSGYHELTPWLILASRLSVKTSTTVDQPYILQQGMGYQEDFIRGYEAYVIDGQHYAMNRTDLKFKLISFTTSLSRFIPIEEFETVPNTIYLTVFNDIGYTKNDNPRIDNALSNTLLDGYGVGLDIVSFYDLVIRFEYAFSIHGDKGLYLHLEKGI